MTRFWIHQRRWQRGFPAVIDVKQPLGGDVVCTRLKLKKWELSTSPDTMVEFSTYDIP